MTLECETSSRFSFFSHLDLAPAALGLFVPRTGGTPAQAARSRVLQRFAACVGTVSKANACLVAAVLACPREA